jgi:hypothetical protein
MADLIQFPVPGPVFNLAEPFRNAIRLGLNLWAQSLEQRREFCRKVVESVSNVWVPDEDTQRQLWEANRELLRFVTDRPFELERGILSLCQSVAEDVERSGTAAQSRSKGREPSAAGHSGQEARANGSAPPDSAQLPKASQAGGPEAKPLHIQTQIGLARPVIVPIRLQNHKNSPSHVRLSATPYIDDQGRLATAPAMRFKPTEVMLPGPGSREAAGLIDTRSGFEPNRVYRADIVLEGDPTMRIPFYIRTLPAQGEQAPGFTAELVGPAGLSRPRGNS